MPDALSSWRTGHIISGLSFFSELKIEDVVDLSPNEMWTSGGNTNGTDIMICFHENDKLMAKFLVDRIRYYLPNARISLPEESKVRHSLLDNALLVVPLLSCSFVASAELTEELNTALCRQRFNNRLVLFPIHLEPLPITPSYFHLIWSLISCEDRVWLNFQTITKNAADDLLIPAVQKCLDFTARLISLIMLHPNLFQGSFKTLLSIQELRDTTLRFRAKLPVDSIGYNPLYFEEAKAGHSPTKENPTVKKDLCHSINTTQCNDNGIDSPSEKAMHNVASDKKASSVEPIQESSECIVEGHMREETPTLEPTGLSSPVEEGSKVVKQPAENAEDNVQGPTDESPGSTSLNRMKLEDADPPPLQRSVGKTEISTDSPSSSSRIQGKEHKSLERHRHARSIMCCVM